MDIMLIDSPTGNMASPTLDSQLEIPSQERLLPIGQHNKDISQLVDKVRQALGLNNQPPKVIENQKNEHPTNGTMQVTIGTPSPRRLIKQVALESPPNQTEPEENLTLCKSVNADNKSEY